MLRRALLLVVLAGLCALLTTLASAGDFFFHDGDDPIVFLGDSITEQRMYTAYIEAYVLTRFPDWKVRFRNIGWSGDVSWLWCRGGYDSGMQRDILPLKPAAITIDFGMNDARGGDGTLPRYIEHSTRLAQDLKAAGARVALCTPSPEERWTPGQPAGSEYNHMLWKYSTALQQVAKEQGVRWVDQYTGFVKVMEDGRAMNIKDFPVLIPDAVHPNWAGHLVMAHQILKGLDAPALVSRAAIDATTRTVTAAQKCKLTEVTVADGVLSFTRLDDCLPMPVRDDSRLVFQVQGYSFLEDLDQYELQVTGLQGASYDLAIDGERVATYSRTQLQAGLSLGLDCGPIMRQALALLDAVLDKNNVYFERWRNVQLYGLPGWLNAPETEALRQRELARLDGEIATREARINELRQPRPHKFTLTPVG